MPDISSNKGIDKTRYKYLGIIKRKLIKCQKMNNKITKEYMERIKAILKYKFNARNMVKTMNASSELVIRYSAGIVESKKSRAPQQGP